MGAEPVTKRVKVTQQVTTQQSGEQAPGAVTPLVAITANGRPIEKVNKVDNVLSVIPVERLLEYVVKNVPAEVILSAVEAGSNPASKSVALGQIDLGQHYLGQLSRKELMQYKKDQAVKLYMSKNVTQQQAGQAFGISGITVSKELKKKRDEYRNRAGLIRRPG